jgi:hypothetical protein
LTVDALLTLIEEVGISITVQGDQLLLDTPKGKLTPELRDTLISHKSALLARLTSPISLITLEGGLTLPLPAVLLALNLETRGLRMTLDADDQFQVEPLRHLTAEDRRSIARWRPHLAAIVGYEAPARG